MVLLNVSLIRDIRLCVWNLGVKFAENLDFANTSGLQVRGSKKCPSRLCGQTKEAPHPIPPLTNTPNDRNFSTEQKNQRGVT